jgi:hypothetical protein
MKRISVPPAALWASAFVLMGLIILQSSRLTGEAQAGVVSSTTGHVILTSEAQNEDLILVIDGRAEQLTVYRPTRNGIDLVQVYRLPDMFADARARAMGTRR